MSNQPLISVVIPTYNRKYTIQRAINSILTQTYKNWEIVIVDDGSVDNTKEEIKQFLNNSKIKYYHQKNSGVCSARNFGILKATGEYVSFLDSDDEYFPDRLEKQLYEMLKVNAIFSLSNRLTAIEGKIDKKIKNIHNKNYFLSKLDVIKLNIPLSATLMMFKKNKLGEIKFEEDLPASNDFDFILRVLNKINVLFIKDNLNLIHKTLKIERISTNYTKKIKGFLIIENKIEKGEYLLNDNEKRLLKESILSHLGLFFIFNNDCASSRGVFKKYFNIKKIDLKYFKNFLLFVFSYFLFFPQILVILSKILWRMKFIKK
ncbi:MAG: glycosyltransferase family 2 protein [Patescibacteria group bacterium]|jgi:glycosyltransferase involved in cell wall biosynthesis